MVYVGKLTEFGVASEQRLVVGHLWRYIIDCSQALLLTRGVMPLLDSVIAMFPLTE
jgi:hypothetical protein